MKSPAVRAVAVGVTAAAVLGCLHALGVGLPLLLALGLVLCVATLVVPWIGMRWLDDGIGWVRGRYWAREQGCFHSFAGVALQVEDDGRHVWVAGDGLQRVLGRDEPEQTLAARHSGHWQRRADGLLMLRVDAVVRYLNTMPGRDAPRVQRLRRYFERDVLYPAQQRRARKA